MIKAESVYPIRFCLLRLCTQHSGLAQIVIISPERYFRLDVSFKECACIPCTHPIRKAPPPPSVIFFRFMVLRKIHGNDLCLFHAIPLLCRLFYCSYFLWATYTDVIKTILFIICQSHRQNYRINASHRKNIKCRQIDTYDKTVHLKYFTTFI